MLMCNEKEILMSLDNDSIITKLLRVAHSLVAHACRDGHNSLKLKGLSVCVCVLLI